MDRSGRLALVASIALAVLAGCGPEPYPATGTLSTESFHSAVAGDDYVLRLRLPPGYEDETRSWPLVVQLDPTYAGLREYEFTVGLISHFAGRGDWDDAIVLGVDYADPATRERDYALPSPPRQAYEGGGADRFFRVLRDEILPSIEERFRIDAARRYLVGHSNGAVFAWYAAFRHAPPTPSLFAGIVAVDGGFEEEMFTYERWHAERSGSLPMRIYASRAVFNGAVQHIVFHALLDRVKDRSFTGLVLTDEEHETDHAGVLEPSFRKGLALMLGGAP